MEWVVAILELIVIILLLVWILFLGGGSVSKQQKLKGEVTALREEIRRVQEMNEALKGSMGAKARLRWYGDLFELVRDLEGLRCAIAGSKACQTMLTRKYNMAPGPELLERILKRSTIDYSVKSRLSDELLVGEVGRSIMESLDKGITLEEAAAEANVPLVVARGQVTRLQILGYLDARLRLTGQGQKALI